MRHAKTGRKLNRTASHRKALFRNLAASLLEHESIKTTNPKALELRKVADRLISLAKDNTPHAIRLAFAYLRDKEVVKKLFTDIGARYAEINGGYTRVLKIGTRKGDAAPMAIIELTQKKEKEGEKAEKKEQKAKAKAKAKAKKEKKEQGEKQAKAAAEKKEKKAKPEGEKKEKKEKKEAKEPKEKKEKKAKPEAAEKKEKKAKAAEGAEKKEKKAKKSEPAGEEQTE
jgi:large subunit ribosomal protein L17